MRQIAAQVGVQAGALYNYIPDKQTLLFDLMRTHMEELLSAWQDEAGADTAPARLERFTRFHIRYHLERPDEVFVSYMELRNLTPDNFSVIEALRRRYEDQLEAILRDGAQAGDFDVPDPKVATMAVIAMVTGVTTWYRTAGRLTVDEVQEIYWQMVRKAVSA